jgi:membrane protein
MTVPLVDRLRRRLPPWLQQAVKPGTAFEIFPFASGLAFYALVSLVPLLIMTVWVASLVMPDREVRELAGQVSRLAPSNIGAGRAVLRIADLGTTLGVASIAGVLWPASAYGAGLKRAFVHLSIVERERHPGLRGRGLVLIVLLPLFVIGSLAGAVAVTGLFAEGLLRVVGWIVALPAAFAGAWTATVVIYRMFPPDVLPWRRIVRGAAFAAAGVAVLSVVFAVSMDVADFRDQYAISAVAAIVLVALWLFWANVLVLVGYRVARAL